MIDVKRVFTVNGKPFFPVGGQSINQSGYNASEAEPAFKAVKALHGNTILIPVYWEQVEPAEGCFDFTSLHEFYLVGYHYRLFLRRKLSTEGVMKPAIPSVYFAFPMSQFVSVEEGHLDEAGEFVADHRRNGDETSNGMWVRPDTGVLRVVLCD